MKIKQETLLELKKLNTKLDAISENNQFIKYTRHPLKFAFYNFIAGIFHSLGTLFGTIVITAIIFYLLSQFKIDLIGATTKLLEESFSRIDWSKIFPAPTIDFNQFKL